MSALVRLPVITLDGVDYPTYRNDRGEVVQRDLDIAAILQMPKPHNIRSTIESHRPDLGEVFQQDGKTSGRGGRPADAEFYLTEAQALFISAKIRTKAAAEHLKRMIAVYMAARAGNGSAAVALAAGPSAPPVLSPIALFEQMLGAYKLQEQNLAAVAATQATHGTRLALVENVQREAALAIVPISPKYPELKPIAKRTLVVEHVLSWAKAMNRTERKAWQFLYAAVKRRLHIDAYAYDLAKGESKIDRLEKLGHMDAIGKVCDQDMQIPPERQRYLLSAHHCNV